MPRHSGGLAAYGCAHMQTVGIDKKTLSLLHIMDGLIDLIPHGTVQNYHQLRFGMPMTDKVGGSADSL